MSFLYPRTITVKRPAQTCGVGVIDGYVAQAPADETIVATEIPASIQAKAAGYRNPAGLPSDSRALTTWRVLTPHGLLADGLVQNRDVIVDDLGRRFQVVAAYTAPLGACFLCEQMES